MASDRRSGGGAQGDCRYMAPGDERANQAAAVGSKAERRDAPPVSVALLECGLVGTFNMGRRQPHSWSPNRVQQAAHRAQNPCSAPQSTAPIGTGSATFSADSKPVSVGRLHSCCFYLAFKLLLFDQPATRAQ